MIEISVITPLKRLENIPKIFSNLRSNIDENILLHWFPIFDYSEHEWFDFWSERLKYLGKENKNFTIHPLLSLVENAIAGHAHRNIVLEIIGDKYSHSFVYNLDDDNILHPNLIGFLVSNEKKVLKHAGILFAQQTKDGRIRLEAKKEKVEVCHVDTAMLLFRVVDAYEMSFIENDYCADGHFIKEFYEKNRRRVWIENTPLCYYNYLSK